MKIVITGSTGFIGKRLIKKLLLNGHKIIALVRNPIKAARVLPNEIKIVNWDLSSKQWIEEIKGAEAIINLAGENIMAKRWSESQKEIIFNSRVLTTKYLIDAILELEHKPKIFISSSAVGFYGNSAEMKDETAVCGDDFLSKVTSAWEKESEIITSFGIRRAILRLGIVLDKNEGALSKMLPAFKFGLGAIIGSGMQYFPWVHVDDVVDSFLFALNSNSMIGIYNIVAPNNVSMKEFSKTLGNVLNRPVFFRIPETPLKVLLGESHEALVFSINVNSKKIIDAGYNFKHVHLQTSLESLLK